jgi:uncharacterized protein
VTLADLTTVAWVALVVSALAAGFAKTAIGGVAMVTVALAASVLPARESTGLVLLLFIVADVYAIAAYRRHADWPTLRALAPAVVVGIVAGAAFVAVAADDVVRRAIGGILLALVLVHLATRRNLKARDSGAALPGALTAGAGVLAGFTSMVANAGGGVMTVYLLRVKLPVMAFLGTVAWFFFMVNLTKLPFAIGLGLISVTWLQLTVILTPLVLLGAWIGHRTIGYLKPALFEGLVLAFTVVAGLNLLVG